MAGDEKSRRSFLKSLVRWGALGGLGAAGALVGWRQQSSGSVQETVWQIDPALCIQCEKCAENCVLEPSAVSCVHAFSLCGYCRLCFGFFQPGAKSLSEGAENQLCPTGAIQRRYVEEPYYEYRIDEALCIGCAKCVKGCNAFGNGSLFLQVRHDRCLHCNECSIARSCPSRAFRKVPANRPYLWKGEDNG